MNLIHCLLYVYLLLRPYYLFESGGLQISDIFLIIAFIFYIISSKKNQNKLMNTLNDNKEFLFFTLLTYAINVIYFIIYVKFKFILSSLYFTFNFMAILLFVACANNNKFIKNMEKILKLNLWIQLIVYLLNIGKYYDPTRYMGTFNDPNQFGYYILLSMGFIYLFDATLKNNKYQLIYFTLSLYLIYLSASTGMMLGMFAFFALWLFNSFRNINTIVRKNKNKIIIAASFLLLIIPTLYLTNNLKLPSHLESSVIFRKRI